MGDFFAVRPATDGASVEARIDYDRFPGPAHWFDRPALDHDDDTSVAEAEREEGDHRPADIRPPGFRGAEILGLLDDGALLMGDLRVILDVFDPGRATAFDDAARDGYRTVPSGWPHPAVVRLANVLTGLPAGGAPDEPSDTDPRLRLLSRFPVRPDATDDQRREAVLRGWSTAGALAGFFARAAELGCDVLID